MRDVPLREIFKCTQKKFHEVTHRIRATYNARDVSLREMFKCTQKKFHEVTHRACYNTRDGSLREIFKRTVTIPRSDTSRML